MKKTNIIALAVCLLLGGVIGYNLKNCKSELEPLPKQENSEGIRGKNNIDKNVNDENLDKYLGRGDTVYRDVRMLEDTATWEKKGGTRELVSFVRGFEVIPYAYLTEFPKDYIDQKAEEGITGLYTGKSLFRIEDEKYVANYKESMSILEAIFPKDKYILLMCGSGGYSNFTKQLLVALGWDESKIYVVGGIGNYKGEYKISTKVEGSDNLYEYSKVPYHNIDFDRLTPID